MHHFALRAMLVPAVLAPTPLAAATLAPPVQRDLQCFMLYAMGVGQAQKANEQKVQQAASLGLTYFLGKLRVEAPTLALTDAIRQEADSLKDDAKTKATGDSCDQEFQKAGAELRNMGQELTGKTEAAPSK
jgi:Zn-dependent oligopeptidase